MKIRYLMAGTALLFSGLLNAQTPAQALEFDGVDDYIDAQYQSYFPNIKTIELRLRPAVLTENVCILGSRESNFQTLFSVHMSNQSIGLWNGVEYQAVNHPFNPGAWYHITLRFHETSMEVYVNNQFAGATANGMSSQQNLILHIGAPYSGAGFESFRGAIDDIRFWDHHRTSAEIDADIATSLTGTEPGLLANYTFNQGFEVSNNAEEWMLMDNTGNPNNGVLRNFALRGRNSNWISSHDGLPLTTDAPVIHSFSPASGSTGSSVHIFGANFSNDPSSNAVYFGTVKAPVINATPERLTVEIPPGISPSPVSIANLQSSLTGRATGAFSSTFAPAPIQFNTNENQWLSINPGSIAYGDLDGDGKADMVTGNEQIGGFTVYRNASQAGRFNNQSFEPQQDFNINGVITAITLEDMNGDGRLDIVGIFAPTSEAIVIQNTTTQTGNITFDLLPPVSAPYGSAARKIIAADLNLDGRQDLAVLTHDGVIILQNISSNSQAVEFSYQQSIQIAGNTVDLIVNDLDEDRKADIAIVDAANNNIATIKNLSENGSFNFSSITTVAVGSDPFAIAASDLNNDGKPELVVSNRGSRTISLLENISGSQSLGFKASGDIDAPSGTSFISMGDIDGDGRPEIINANDEQNSFTIYRNETPYQLTLAPQSFASPLTFQTYNGAARFPTLVDVDGDGRLDVTILSTWVDYNNETNSIVNYLHNGLPPAQKPTVYGFTPESAPIGATVVINAEHLPGSPYDTRVMFGAVNATIESMDQYSITVTVPAGATFSQISVVNSGTGMTGTSSTHFIPSIGASSISFSSELKLITSGQATGLTVADLDNDDKPDIAAGNFHENFASLFTNISSNQLAFSSEMPVPTMSGIMTTVAGDFDGDGKSDLLNAGTDHLAAIHFNNGSPTMPAFYREAHPLTTENSRQVAVADVDGNGWNDFASIDTKYGYINITLNTSSPNQPSFGMLQQVWGAHSPGAIAFADLNNDRKPDLVVTNTEDNQVYIFYNYSTTGTVQFNLEKVVPVSGTPGKIVTGDMNGDGTLEIIVAIEGSGTAAIIHRPTYDLSNNFSSTIEFAVGDFPVGIAMGDINGDGKPDIAVTNQGDNTISILPNNGLNNDISFGTRLVFSVGAAPQEVAIADFDGDGRADIVVTNADEPSISLLTNTGHFITLPVKLADFKATKRSEDVLLTWNTASENNSLRFEIERSSDGQQFVKIGSMSAAGESTVRKGYSFVDHSPKSGINYYRVRSIDRDGKSTTSATQVVSFDQMSKVEVKLAPQPMDAVMTVAISGAPAAANFVIVDMKGQTIRNIPVNGNATFTVNKTRLPTGMYVYKLLDRSGKIVYSGKIMVR